MRKRMVAWLLAAVVVGTLGVGAVLLAGARTRAPHPLPPLGVAGQATAARPATAATGNSGGQSGGAGPQVRGTLPSLPSTARAWTLRPVGADRVAELAAALGLHAGVQAAAGGWTVRDGGRLLQVTRAAGGRWSYSSGPQVRPCPPLLRTPQIACVVTGAADPGAGSVVPDGAGSAGGRAAGTPAGAGSAAAPATPATPGGRGTCLVPPTGAGEQPTPICRGVKPLPRPAGLPSARAAEAAARSLLQRAGFDLAGATSRVLDGASGWVVTVEPAVGGLPTSGFQLTVTVGPASRIVAAGGWLATPTPADRYPLIGVAQALKRLAAVQVGPPVVDPGVPVRCVRGPCPAPAPPTPRPRTPVTVTGVRLGLQFAPVLGGATPTSTAYLVPAYLFQLSNGVTEPVIAVQDRFLSRPAPPATAAPLRTLPGG